MKKNLFSILIIMVFFFTSTGNTVVKANQINIPVTAGVSLNSDLFRINYQSINYSNFNQFIKTVTTKHVGKQNVGLIVPKKFTLPISQQPSGRPDYVSTEPEVVTEFSLARQYGSTGFLAHNNLAGSHFADLKINDLIVLVTASKEYKLYQIENVLSFQALEPNNPYSNFVDLDNNQVLSAVELFMEVYANEGTVVIQTCIEKNGEPSWGRLFIQAVPVSGIGIEELIDFEQQRIRLMY